MNSSDGETIRELANRNEYREPRGAADEAREPATERDPGITDAQLANWFSYHAPTPKDVPSFTQIRQAGHVLAEIIRDLTPPGADQSAAIRKVREAVMTANAAIACGGR